MLKARADVGELLVDARALLLLVLAIPDVADKDREAAHAGERHGGREGRAARVHARGSGERSGGKGEVPP